MNLPTLSEAGSLNGKRVILRAGLNVPIKNDQVANEFRITRALKTIDLLHEQGAKVLIMSHIGREASESLRPVYQQLIKEIPDIMFADNLFSDETEAKVATMQDGDIILFENLRSDPREKTNDEGFVKCLANYADIFVNDAFTTSHREHASIVGLAHVLPSYAGLQFEEEVSHLEKALAPEHPALFILGGAKFETKQAILRMSLKKYDHIFIGGALAHDFLIARGVDVGQSLHSDDPSGIDDIAHHEKLVLPVDAVVANEEGIKRIVPVEEVAADEKILDIGPESVRRLADLVKQSPFILWNGPLGFYEGGYGESTEAIAELVAARDNTSIVGGGDTVAAIASRGLEDQFTFLSTGGGAMLDFLADGTLAGIEALAGSPDVPPEE